jgi:hypothetical protein
VVTGVAGREQRGRAFQMLVGERNDFEARHRQGIER